MVSDRDLRRNVPIAHVQSSNKTCSNFAQQCLHQRQMLMSRLGTLQYSLALGSSQHVSFNTCPPCTPDAMHIGMAQLLCNGCPQILQCMRVRAFEAASSWTL